VSDLQCPARFLVLADPDGAAAGSLRHERVAAVYGAPPHADGLTALAGALGVPLRAVERRLTVAEVVAESAGALDVLRDLADLHRGETVVVAGEGPAGQRVEVSVDGDGVTVVPVSPGAGT
jgi:hypothetical protein